MTVSLIFEQAFAGIATSQQCLYVIGGYSGQQAQKSCQVFNPSTDEWTPIADLHEGQLLPIA